MDIEILKKRFLSLTEFSRKSCDDLESFFDPKETIAALSPAKFAAYKKLLSSIATVESVESVILKPVAEHFRGDPILTEYIASHALDEHFHAEMFAGYVRQCFSYEKKKRTLTDQVIYDRALPFLAGGSKARPVAFTLAVYFFEKYASFLYEELKKTALRDGLPGLVRMIEAVEKDERRHMVGIEAVFHTIRENGSVSLVDRWATRGLLALLLVDVSQSPFAIYNRHIRKNMITLGIDPDYIDERGRWSARQTLAIMKEKSEAQ